MRRLFYIILTLLVIGITVMYTLHLLTTKNFNFEKASTIEIIEPIFPNDPIGLVREWETYSVTNEEARLLLIYLDNLKFVKYPGYICESSPITYEVKMNIDGTEVRFEPGCNYFLANIYKENKKLDTVYANAEYWKYYTIVESILKDKSGDE